MAITCTEQFPFAYLLGRLQSGINHNFQNSGEPWLVWLGWSGIILRTEGLLVWFLVGAHAWVVGLVPAGACMGGGQSRFLCSVDVSLSVSFPLSSPLSKK